VPIDRDSFHRVLAIELGTSIDYGADQASGPDVTTVWLSCSEEGIELRVEDGVTRKSMRRVIDLTPVEASARSRLLALTVAEFVVASWVELRLPAPAPIEPAGPPPNVESQQAVKQIVRERLPPPPVAADSGWHTTWQLQASAAISFFSSLDRPVPAGELRLLQRPTSHFAFEIGLQIGHSQDRAHFLDQTIGSVRFTTTSALVAARYVATFETVDLSAGIGARVGLAHMAGRSDRDTITAKSFYAPYGGPLVLGSLAYHLTQHLRLVFDLEAGLVTQPARASLNGSSVFQLNGAWGAGSLGLAWLF
ncbi:MAG TPA: hypothetical protein VGI70_06630, partial [Polyangiales bacterium]